MKPVIAILNPRLIPEVMKTISSWKYPKLWISFHTEMQIAEEFDKVLSMARSGGFTHMSMISDDGVMSEKAINLVYNYVRKDPNGVYCGWCNVDSGPEANMWKTPLPSSTPVRWAHLNLYTIKEIEAISKHAELMRTYFGGMAFHTMSLDMWERYPFGCYKSKKGHSSDYHISYRLQVGGVPIWCVTGARIHHIRTNRRNREHRLLIGKKPKELRLEVPHD